VPDRPLQHLSALESITYRRDPIEIVAIVIRPPMCRDHLRVFKYTVAPKSMEGPRFIQM
jgi:hypothetical protein